MYICFNRGICIKGVVMNYRNIFKSIWAMLLLSCALPVFAMMSLTQEKQMLFDMCAKGDIAGVSRLIDSGANINVRDLQGWTPLHRACQRGDKDLVVFLVEHGADVYTPNGQGLTAFHIAFMNEHDEIADYIDSLLERKGERAAQIKKLKQIIEIPE